MKRFEKLFAAGLASILAGIYPHISSGAGTEVLAQELMSVKASGQVTAHWLKNPESYILQVVMERSKPRPAAITPASTEQKVSQPPTAAPPGLDRSSFFIGNTIANLRGLDPTFSCIRTLSLVDGRRPAPNTAGLVGPAAPYDPKAKQPRVEVWLLKADGTQIASSDYSCNAATTSPAATDVRYEYPATAGSQAVAAAIRIDNEYYIEKLQTLNPAAAP